MLGNFIRQPPKMLLQIVNRSPVPAPPEYHLITDIHPIIFSDQDASIAAECLARVAGDAQGEVSCRVVAIRADRLNGASGADANATLRSAAIRRKGYLPEKVVTDRPDLCRRGRSHGLEQQRTCCRNLFVTVGLLLGVLPQASHHGCGGIGRALSEKCEKLAA